MNCFAHYSPNSTFGCFFRKKTTFHVLLPKMFYFGQLFLKILTVRQSYDADTANCLFHFGPIQQAGCQIRLTTVLLSLVHLRQCGCKFWKPEPWRWSLVKSNDVSCFSAGDKSDRSKLREPATLGTGKNRSCKERKGVCRRSSGFLLFCLISFPDNYVKTISDLSSNWDIIKASITAPSCILWCI